MQHSNDKLQQLATIMGDITITVLWQSSFCKSLLDTSSPQLKTRVGSGRATYCKYHRLNNELCITYGKKMISSKFNHNEAELWLSFRELVNKQYFEGDSRLLNVLSQTICHEFSHALQQLQGKVFKGSIHNQHFYQILDQLHINGLAKEVKQALDNKCNHAGIDLSYAYDTQSTTIADIKFTLNDKVQFRHKKKLMSGKIIKINKRSLTIETKGLFSTTRWRVPKQHALISKH